VKRTEIEIGETGSGEIGSVTDRLEKYRRGRDRQEEREREREREIVSWRKG